METCKEIDLGKSAAGSHEPQEREKTGGVCESPSNHLYIKCTAAEQRQGASPLEEALPCS